MYPDWQQTVCSLPTFVPVNGKPQVICKCDIFGIATMFSAIIEVFVPAGTSSSIKLFDPVVNVFYIIALIRKEGIFRYGEEDMGIREDI